MKKPHLVITEEINGAPVQGRCSSCPDIKPFDPGAAILSVQQHRTSLELQFREHFRTVHERENATAAPTLRTKVETENAR
jgi:hypothetical protein